MIHVLLLLIFSLPMALVTFAAQVSELLDKIVRSEGLLHKKVAIECGVDPAQWSRGINDKGAIDCRWLPEMPPAVFDRFIRGLILLHLDTWIDQARAERKELVR